MKKFRLIWPWSRIRQLEGEVEILKQKLAVVYDAATNSPRKEGYRGEWQSAALLEVLRLRRRIDELESRA